MTSLGVGLANSDAVYPLAPNGVFRSVQGEGHLAGWPMVFVRLAGCSVGCPGCDTDYRVTRRASVEQIVAEVEPLLTSGVKWLWVTGGEPTDHDLRPLCSALRSRWSSLNLALATSGVRKVEVGGLWLSVSPHTPNDLSVTVGAELKLCDRVNGHRLADFEATLVGTQFAHRFVQPFWDDRLDAVSSESVRDCLDWCSHRPGWRVSFQGHKQLRIA